MTSFGDNHRVNWFGPARIIERREKPDELIFIITPQQNGMRYLIAGVAVAVAIGCFLARHFAWGALFIVTAGMVVSGDSEKAVAVVTASVEGVQGNGFLYRWRRIRSLEYWQGGNDGDPGGLFVRTGNWSDGTLLAEVSREEAEMMIDLIYRKFPYAEMATDNASNPLDVFRSKPITLDLNRPDDSQQSPLH